MGVPKFFRWISERYPCLGELIKDYQVPEFDNLYLDMNGIFHVCSHPDEDNVHFRITEDDIFKNILHYIEVLFQKINPKKVFFMAVDGVAPRAKMNQQRGRRFRTAQIAEDAINKARNIGEELPSAAPFDSNCITPGTEFMTKLDEHLKYFISKKISTDTLWQSCTVIYSGHKTPGEGEHKIMDYIRFCRSQDDYDPNTGHCLYGLDADLIMLGLASHEPHFSLLREEIIYGKKSRKIKTPEEINFYLFHLSLLREYLHLEFACLHSIHFGYDIECVIDDFVLLGFLVGNDFIPNLPELHINKDGLSLLFRTYKNCLPKLDGYINENGALHFKRFEVFMQHLSEVEIDRFRDINDDQKYLASKSAKRMEDEIDDGIDLFSSPFNDDNTFVKSGSISNQEVRSTFQKLGLDEPEEFSESEDSSLPEDEQIFRSEFRQYKCNYYRTKYNLEIVNDEVLKAIAVHYVRGIQWILNYYFNGICSWNWFYPFHYSPYISDVANFSDVEIKFDMSTAFLPFQQLMAVLPPYSMSIVPEAYHPLMNRENSPIKDFYPHDFQTDLNGKFQEWEAVVLIPFIDECLLINSMESCNVHLSKEEIARNQHGPQYLYTFTEDNLGSYKAPYYFSSVTVNHAVVREKPKDAWLLKESEVFKGLHPDVDLNVHFNGFPTLRHLDHTFRISKEDVKVFQHASRNDSIILQVSPSEELEVADIVKTNLDKIIYVSWPHLSEAKVTAIKDGTNIYEIIDKSIQVRSMNPPEIDFMEQEKKSLSSDLLKRWGIDSGPTKFLIICKTLCGLSYNCTRDGKISLEKQWSNTTSTFPFQLSVSNIEAFKPNYKMFDKVEDLFLVGTKVFMLGMPHYGSIGTVLKIIPVGERVRVRVEMIKYEEPNLSEAKRNFYHVQESYMTAYMAASRICMSSLLFAKITGTILVSPAARLQPFQRDQKFVAKTNIGLNLKNNVKDEEVKGYTRKENNVWLYSELCVQTVETYYNDFAEVFKFISSNESNSIHIYQDEIFEENWQENFQKLKTYIEESSFKKAERKKCSSLMLDEASLELAEAEIKKYSRIVAKSVNMQIMPHLLYMPSSLHGSSPPDSTAKFELLDRVMNVREGFSMPLGARGTIIGIYPSTKEDDTLYDVMFDEEFIGGTALLGPISVGRCCRMYWSAIINLSHGDRQSRITTNDFVTTADRSKWFDQKARRKIQYRKLYANELLNDGPKPVMSCRDDSSNHRSPMKSGRDDTVNCRSPAKSWRKEATGFQVTTYNGNSAKNTKPNSPHSLPDEQKVTIAPAPCSLPNPFQFALKTFLSEKDTEGNDYCKETKEQPINKEYETVNQVDLSLNNESPQSNEGNVQVQRPKPDIQVDLRKLEFLLHGTQCSNWDIIQREGLGNGKYVSCVSYIPNFIELLIYLNVPKLQKDGHTFIKHVNGDILCSTNSFGKIPFHYIDKAYDTRNESLIYVSRSCQNENLHLPNVNRVLRAKGRGQAMRELREEVERNDPVALGRRIRGGMQNLDSIFKERIVLSKIMSEKDKVDLVQPEQFQDHSDQLLIDLRDIGCPPLPAPVVEESIELPRKISTSAVIDLLEEDFPPLGTNIFVPTQVFRSNASLKRIPEVQLSPSLIEPSTSNTKDYSQNVTLSKKERSPIGERKPKKVRRCRLVANLGWSS